MQPMIFINLPTRDLQAADAFYGSLGFEKNPTFSSDDASCWVISDTIYVMVLQEQFYASFLRDGDTPNLRSASIGTLHALAVESTEALRGMLERAVSGGGSVYRAESEPFPGMIDSAIKDPDGHVWELTWMDQAAMAPAEEG